MASWVPVREAGWRDVDRLFEIWTVERVWLVEQSEHRQAAVRHQPLDRHFEAGDEGLDQHGRLARRESFVGQHRADALVCGRKLGSVVGPNHAPAAVESSRLDDHRVGKRGRNARRVEVELERTALGGRQVGIVEALPHHRLVAAGDVRTGQVVASTQAVIDGGGDLDRCIVDREDGGIGPGPDETDQFGHCRARKGEVEMDGVRRSRRGRAGRIDPADDVEIEIAGRPNEGGQPVTARSRQQQDCWSISHD